MRKFIIDADTGTDDAVAISHILMQKDIEVLGITAVHGNQPVSSTTNNALKLVDFLGKDIPVFKGCAKSLVRDILPGRDHNPIMEKVRGERDGEMVFIHQPDITELPETSRKYESENAVSFIVRTINESKEPISIIALGPLTNIAAALILDSSIAKKIDKIYIMGGQVSIGNRTPVAEANFYDDPEAAHIVLTSTARCIVTPVEPSLDTKFDKAFLAELDNIGNDVAKLIRSLTDGFIDRMTFLGIYPKGSTSSGMCDWSAILSIIDDSLILEREEIICQVELSGGFADGMLVADRRSFAEGERYVTLIRKIDSERAKERFLTDIKNFTR